MTPLRSPAPDHEGAIASAPYRRHRRIHRSRSHPRPRVLQLLATGGNGGAQESYTGLLLRLDRSAYEVRALSLSSGSAVQRLRRLGLEVEVIEEADDEAAVRELTAYLVRNEIDLLHAHMYRAEVVGARAALAAGTAVVMATVHSSRVRSVEDIATLAALTPVMDRLIVPSASIVAKVRAEGRGGASFSVIPNGVDLARFDLPVAACALRREFAVPGAAPLLGVVARLEPEKGHRYLIDAMPAILRGAPEAWLVIVGEGSLDAELRAQAADLPGPARERVVFTGRREDVAAITGDVDIAVLPSLREAQGISILEAMARRKPVVASAVGGIPEVLTNGLDGLLVPPADPAALAEACIRLAYSPELRTRMGEAGRATVEARFSLDAMVRQIEEVYDEELVRAGALPPQRAPARGGGAQPVGRAAIEVPPSSVSAGARTSPTCACAHIGPLAAVSVGHTCAATSPTYPTTRAGARKSSGCTGAQAPLVCPPSAAICRHRGQAPLYAGPAPWKVWLFGRGRLAHGPVCVTDQPRGRAALEIPPL